MNKIYLTEYNKDCDRQLIIDGDEHSVLVYIMKNSNNGKGIDFDGFLCSRGTILKSSEQVKKYIDNSFQPPLTERYMNEFSIQKEINSQMISIDWQVEFVSIFINKTEYLKMDILKRKSYSKSVSETGPYGFPLTNKNK